MPPPTPSVASTTGEEFISSPIEHLYQGGHREPGNSQWSRQPIGKAQPLPLASQCTTEGHLREAAGTWAGGCFAIWLYDRSIGLSSRCWMQVPYRLASKMVTGL